MTELELRWELARSAEAVPKDATTPCTHPPVATLSQRFATHVLPTATIGFLWLYNTLKKNNKTRYSAVEQQEASPVLL